MLNIYFKEGLEIGYDFYDFKAEEYGYVFQKYEYESQLEAELTRNKIDLVIFNIEEFIVRFDSSAIMKNELQVTALNRLFDFRNWALESQDKPLKMFKSLLKMEDFIVTIVNAYNGKERQRAIKEWKLLMQFLTKELKDGK